MQPSRAAAATAIRVLLVQIPRIDSTLNGTPQVVLKSDFETSADNPIVSEVLQESLAIQTLDPDQIDKHAWRHGCASSAISDLDLGTSPIRLCM